MVGGRERSSLTLTSGGCVSVIWLACAWYRPAREGGLVVGHKQFTQQLLADLHLTLPLNSRDTQPSPAASDPPADTASPPWDHKDSLQRDFTALIFQTLLPREHLEIQVCSTAFTWQETLSPCRDTADDCSVNKEMRGLRNEGFITAERGANITEWRDFSMQHSSCAFLYLQMCPLMLSHPPCLHPISFHFQQFHCSLSSSALHCSLDRLIVPGGLCHEMWGIWESSTVCSNSQDSSAWLSPSLSPTEGHRHSWLWVWHHTDRERQILPQPICILNIHCTGSCRGNTTANNLMLKVRSTAHEIIAVSGILVIWKPIGASLNW